MVSVSALIPCVNCHRLTVSLKLGSAKAVKIPIMVMTTNSSTPVKPRLTELLRVLEIGRGCSIPKMVSRQCRLSTICWTSGRSRKDGRLLRVTMGVEAAPRCRIPDDCISENRYPLFMARAVMRELIESLQSPSEARPC